MLFEQNIKLQNELTVKNDQNNSKRPATNPKPRRTYLVQMTEQGRSGRLYVPAVKRYVRHVHRFHEHSVRLERVHERHHAFGGPGHRAVLRGVVAGHVHVSWQLVHDGRVADPDRGHHAVG